MQGPVAGLQNDPKVVTWQQMDSKKENFHKDTTTMQELQVMLEYAVRVAPGMGVGVLFCSFLPHKLEIVRVLAYIFIFVLLRDTMTPLQLWTIRASFSEGMFWIRMHRDPLILSMFGASSLILCAVISKFHSHCYPLGGNSVLVWKCKGT